MRHKEWLSCLMLVVACDGANSTSPEHEGPKDHYSNQENARFHAGIMASAQGGVTRISVTLADKDSGEPFNILAEDLLLARSGKQEAELVLDETLGEAVYVAQLQLDAPGTRIDVTLDSDTFGDASATVTLPDRVTMTAPSAESAPDIDEPFTVTWKGGKSADLAEARYRLECPSGQLARGFKSNSEDTGSQELEIGLLFEPTTSCALEVGAARQQYGTMQGAWGGFAIAEQVDSEAWTVF